MRNILLFIRRYFNLVFFLFLQGISLYFLFTYNRYHEAAFMTMANEGAGWINSQYDGVEQYFNLKSTNAALVAENEMLRNQLRQNMHVPDTGSLKVEDSYMLDSLKQFRQYFWRSAKVVGNSVGLQNNYMTIHRGEMEGVRKDMGVISAQGIAGSVVATSDHYAIVMSLLHRQSRVSAKIKKTGNLGIIQWDGTSPLYLNMINVPKSVPIQKGDTIVTSQYSYLFPPGIMVGTVKEIVNDKASNFFTLHITPATDFYKVEYVTVVENLQKEEQKKLEESTNKNQ